MTKIHTEYNCNSEGFPDVEALSGDKAITDLTTLYAVVQEYIRGGRGCGSDIKVVRIFSNNKDALLLINSLQEHTTDSAVEYYIHSFTLDDFSNLSICLNLDSDWSYGKDMPTFKKQKHEWKLDA